jgi:hypothetical protein
MPPSHRSTGAASIRSAFPAGHIAPEAGQRDLRGREGSCVAERRRGRELLDERLQLGQPLPDPRVADERRLLGRLARDEELGRLARPVEQRLEQLVFSAGKAGPGVRQLLEQPPHGGREEGQRGGVAFQQRGQRRGVGCADRVPRLAGELEHQRRDRASLRPERLELVGAERPEVVRRLDQLDGLVGRREDLQELQLVVEVVLEPEDDLRLRLERVAEEPVAALERLQQRPLRAPAASA